MSHDKPASPNPGRTMSPAPATRVSEPATFAGATKQTVGGLPLPPSPATEPQFAPAAEHAELGRLGKYRIQKELGRGGMGAVYLAFDERLQRQVALKVMLPQEAANVLAKERFLREARAAARINSDYVVSIFEADEIDGIPFIALQYLEGHSLHDAPARQGPLTIAQIIRVGMETALGLAAAHRFGFVHRDIKPSNLWLEKPHSRVKILDFGLARKHDDNVQLTHTGAVVGTPAYMSPEQGRGHAVDGRSDLFSLGSVLYHLCAGRLPFQGDSTMALLMSIGMDEPTPIRAFNPNVPVSLASLIHRLLEKDPNQRPSSAQAVADELNSILQAVTSSTTVPPPQFSTQFSARITSFGDNQVGDEPFGEVIAEDRIPTNKIAVSLREAFQPPPQQPSRLVWFGSFLFAGLVLAGIVFFVHDYLRNRDSATHPVDGTTPPQDADRLAAAYVLGIGGTVWINDVERDITTAAELPQEAFRLTGVDFDGNQRVGDRGLAVFNDCTNLTHLAIQSAPISDAGLAAFKRSTNLTHLALINLPVGDGGLTHFRDCSSLTQVHLAGTKVSNEGVKELSGKTKLTYLNLERTKVTGAGIESLRKALPRCTIEWGGNTIVPTK